MEKNNILPALLLGGFLCAGLVYVGQTASTALLQMKAMERTVTVKGLAEKEVKANVAIWPINFTEVDNNLPKLYETVQQKTDRVVAFLKEQGFSDSEITISLPSIEDRQAQGYVDPNVRYRYSAKVNLSVYTPQIDLMLNTRKQMINLVKEGIAIASQDYDNRTEFLFTDLNSVKPIMCKKQLKMPAKWLKNLLRIRILASEKLKVRVKASSLFQTATAARLTLNKFASFPH